MYSEGFTPLQVLGATHVSDPGLNLTLTLTLPPVAFMIAFPGPFELQGVRNHNLILAEFDICHSGCATGIG